MTLPPQLIMIVWIPIVFYLFRRFQATEAVIISFVVAWLFLPQRAGFAFPGLPDYERMSATVYGILLATVVYDLERFKRFSFSWVDLPMAVWCACPLFSSLSNELGFYNGISLLLLRTMSYGGPYFLGRIYLNNLRDIRKLAIAILVSGLVYVPLCLYEIRMSPQLHRLVYGYHGNPSFAQTIRYGGFRPTVFMEHGLAVGMWMMAATLIGIWFWKTGVIREIYGIHIRWLVGILFVTFILIKSTGAYGLLFLGVIFLFVAWQFHTSLTLVILIAAMGFYLQQNVVANSDLTERIITTIEPVAPVERLESLQYRFDNEELLKAKAQERIVLGWGGWGRNRVYEYDWKGDLVDVAVTDSLWILAFGMNGLVGLTALFSSVLVPVLSFVWYFPAKTWSNTEVAATAALTIIIALYMLDCLLNNQPNPVFTLATGGISGLVVYESTKYSSKYYAPKQKPVVSPNSQK
ncbi:MAG: O-antigen ligase domain-containing protein [Cyanobacteria bacterium P01_C01_bin.72]